MDKLQGLVVELDVVELLVSVVEEVLVEVLVAEEVPVVLVLEMVCNKKVT
jgi:hypothetical protein